MPELPEVESIKNYLFNIISNCRVLYIKILQNKLKILSKETILNIKNKKIIKIYRIAKFLILSFKKKSIIIHFGMSGKIILLNKYISPNIHDHIDIYLNNGKIIRFSDYRRFGMFYLIENNKINLHFSKWGIDPLNFKFNGNMLFKLLQNKNKMIKPLLMQGELVSGIGNIYANESLFYAKILPYRKSNTLSKLECLFLVKNIKSILLKAIKFKGTTFSSFINPNMKKGNFFNNLKIYKRGNLPCFICNNIIQSIKIYQRNSFFCIKCQK